FPGADPAVPLYGFVFLVALGIDYNIFLMTRVREEALAGGTRRGVTRGLAITGGNITSAGLVLAATFTALAVIPVLFLAQLAFFVAFGVLLDKFVVRLLLVPALSYDVGRAIWWPSRPARGRRRPRPGRRSAAARAEPLRAHARRVVPLRDEHARDRLDEPRRAADVHARRELGRPAPRGELRVGQPAGAAQRGERHGTREDRPRLEPVTARDERGELVRVELVLGGAHGADQPERRAVAGVAPGARHRHERHQARAAGQQQHGRPGVAGRVPHEPAADRPPDLDGGARREVVDEVRGHLAVGDALDGHLDAARAVGRARQGVGPLGGVPVGGGEPQVDVLPGLVPRPAGHVEHEGRCRRALGTPVHEGRELPAGADGVPAAQTRLLSHPGTAARATGRPGRGTPGAPRSRAC